MKTRYLRIPGNLLAVCIAGLLLLSCSGTKTLSLENTAQPAEIASATLPPTSTIVPTPTQPSTLAAPTQPPPTLTPTPLGGSLGGLLLVKGVEDPPGYPEHDLLFQPAGAQQPVPLVPEKLKFWAYAPSPDGTRALLLVNYSPVQYGDPSSPDRNNVFTLSLADGLLTNLTDTEGADASPDWSPDGQAVAYTRSVGGNGSYIMRVNIDGSGRAQLTSDGISFSPKWSPDGQSIAFLKRSTGDISHVYLMSADGKRSRQLTSGHVYDGWWDGLAWSPDGQYLAFSRVVFDAGGAPDPAGGGMMLLNPVTGTLEQVSNGITKLPTWSPDGKKLAYSTGGHCMTCGSGLVVMDLESQVKTTLVEYNDRVFDAIGWSPDGTMIQYSTWQTEGAHSIYRAKLIDVRTAKEVGAWDEYAFFYWLPQAIEQKTPPTDCPAGASRLSAGGQAVLAADRPANPLRVFPGTQSYQLGEINQGVIVTLITRACAPDRIYWLVKLPDGSQGWTAEGNGKTSWLVPYTGQALLPAPTKQPTEKCTNKAGYVMDWSVPDYTKITAGERFTKSWRIINAGTCTWTSQYTWQLVDGEAYGASESIAVIPAGKEVLPGEVLDISIQFTAPAQPGTYKSTWQMHDPFDTPFGTKPYLIFMVP